MIISKKIRSIGYKIINVFSKKTHKNINIIDMDTIEVYISHTILKFNLKLNFGEKWHTIRRLE